MWPARLGTVLLVIYPRALRAWVFTSGRIRWDRRSRSWQSTRPKPQIAKSSVDMCSNANCKAMIFWVSLLLCAAALLPSGLGSPHASCTFSIPSTNASGSCDTYKLAAFAEIKTWPYFNATGNHSYIFSLCANVPSSALPQPCANASEAVAYQYFNNSKTCYRLGSLKNVYVVSNYALKLTFNIHIKSQYCS